MNILIWRTQQPPRLLDQSDLELIDKTIYCYTSGIVVNIILYLFGNSSPMWHNNFIFFEILFYLKLGQKNKMNF